MSEIEFVLGVGWAAHLYSWPLRLCFTPWIFDLLPELVGRNSTRTTMRSRASSCTSSGLLVETHSILIVRYRSINEVPCTVTPRSHAAETLIREWAIQDNWEAASHISIDYKFSPQVYWHHALPSYHVRIVRLEDKSDCWVETCHIALNSNKSRLPCTKSYSSLQVR